jgi:hypothetical protein
VIPAHESSQRPIVSIDRSFEHGFVAGRLHVLAFVTGQVDLPSKR